MIAPHILHLARLLELNARKRLGMFFSGSYLSSFQGEGLDFREVREYADGDEARHINWNVTARYGTPFIKTFNEDRNIHLIIAADISSSMDFGSGEKTKLEILLEITSLLLLLAANKRFKSSFIAFSDTINLYLPLRQGRAQTLQILSLLLEKIGATEAQNEPTAKRGVLRDQPRRTDLDLVCDFIEKTTRKKGVLFILSDFLGIKYFKLV